MPKYGYMLLIFPTSHDYFVCPASNGQNKTHGTSMKSG